MMRLCPKCGDYFADPSLAFCLGDGTPLVDVNPLSESWGEGRRVVEGKENALRLQQRRLRRRRILSVAVTMLIATMVLLVVAVNGIIYLKPQREEVALATPPAPPATTPAEPVGSVTPSVPEETSPTSSPTPTATRKPTPTPTLTPTPTPVYKISGRVTAGGKALGGVNLTLGGSKTASATTDANGNYTFSRLPAGGSYTVTPAGTKIDFTPRRRPINNLTRDQSADFVATVQSEQTECSDADQSREREIVTNSCRGVWRQNIEGDQNKILAEFGVSGIEDVKAVLSVKIDYQITFSETCQAGVATARYKWQVTAPAIRIGAPRPREKRFNLVKVGGRWRCG